MRSSMLVLAGVMAAFGGAYGQPDPDSHDEGRMVFMRFCSFCHVLREADDSLSIASGLKLPGQPEGVSAQRLTELITDPPPGMPAIRLAADELSVLLDFLLFGEVRTIYTDTNHP